MDTRNQTKIELNQNLEILIGYKNDLSDILGTEWFLSETEPNTQDYGQ